ncbi:MAG: aspartate-semialdehyde dehydrogenase [Acholeplasmataceae bacterium]
MKAVNIAVVGATGMVGRQMICSLEEQKIPINQLYLFSSSKSEGQEMTFNNQTYVSQRLTETSFNQDIDYALFSAGGQVSLVYAPIAASKNVIVIDNSSAFRMDQNVPLVVPEVNPEALGHHQNIIANPNCSTIQSVLPLKPLYDRYGIKRVIYTTYQAVSGSGVKGVLDLNHSDKNQKPRFYPKPILGNVLPVIDTILENGYTKEEEKMIFETRKILNDENIRVTATCVRVPVENGHSVSINVELKTPFHLEDIISILKDAPGIKVFDQYDMATPLDVSGQDLIYVGRIRRDHSVENGLNLWVVGDNIRKGAATNAVQILKKLMEDAHDTI